jgi:hypothetical protein
VKSRCLILLAAACVLRAQPRQEGPRPEWPCIAGRAVDPAYLETSESTGGQVFLFQKAEIGQTALFLSADRTHPATVLRAIGSLSGSSEFEFPVDSSMQSLLVTASVQCRKTISLFRPSGTEMTPGNSTESVDLQASRAVRVDNPEPGNWKIRLQGTGMFVLAVRAQSALRLVGVDFVDQGELKSQPLFGIAQTAVAHVAGEVASLRFEMIGPNGAVISAGETLENADGVHRFSIAPTQERFRVRITGVDSLGWPVVRTHPILFRAHPQN